MLAVNVVCFCIFPLAYTDNKRRPPDVGLMLAQRLRRWASIRPTSGGGVLFAM